MPFVTSEVTTHLQSDGRYLCHERHTDGLGVVHEWSYIADSVAEATTARDARFANSGKQRRLDEIRRLLRHFNEDGGTFASFVVDAFPTRDALRTRILKRFRNREYRRAKSHALAVLDMTVNKIKTLLGLPNNPSAQAILDRATAILSQQSAESTWYTDLVDDDGTE